MRNTYRGYFRLPDSSLEKTWAESIFVFDANIMLNFYRYSDSTRGEFLKTIGRLKNQIWLPYQAGLEYLQRRIDVIVQQEKLYDEAIKKIDDLLESFEHTRQHPFVDEKFLSNIRIEFSTLKEMLNGNRKICIDRINKDDIQEKIIELFDGKVGPRLDENTLIDIFEEGKQRYLASVPPGYMDAKKGEQDFSHAGKVRQFGDFIIWKEILTYGSSHEQDVVFVTDDRKEDWWRRISGRTIGPRPELVEEFFANTGKSFEMYEAHRFFEISNRLLKIQSRPKAVEEIKEVSRIKRLVQNAKDETRFNDAVTQSHNNLRLAEQELLSENERIRKRIDIYHEILGSNDAASIGDGERFLIDSELARLFAMLHRNTELTSKLGENFSSGISNIEKVGPSVLRRHRRVLNRNEGKGE